MKRLFTYCVRICTKSSCILLHLLIHIRSNIGGWNKIAQWIKDTKIVQTSTIFCLQLWKLCSILVFSLVAPGGCCELCIILFPVFRCHRHCCIHCTYYCNSYLYIVYVSKRYIARQFVFGFSVYSLHLPLQFQPVGFCSPILYFVFSPLRVVMYVSFYFVSFFFYLNLNAFVLFVCHSIGNFTDYIYAMHRYKCVSHQRNEFKVR